MAARKGGLGKGLDSLITDKVSTKQKSTAASPGQEQKKEAETLVKISKVEPNKSQPRKDFNEDALLELSESIKQFGVLQPLLVQDRKDYYEIVAGERRWRAAKMAGLKEVPVIIKNWTEQEIAEISLIENIQREDLNPIEEARAYQRLLNEFKMKHDELAEKVSKSRTSVTNAMRLLKLCEPVQQMVIDDMISTGHARALISIEDSEKQYQLAQKIFDERLSVRETEKLVKNVLNGKEPIQKKKKPDQQLDYIYKNVEEQMKRILGTKVSIKHKDENKGRIEIEYYSADELNRIMEMINSIK